MCTQLYTNSNIVVMNLKICCSIATQLTRIDKKVKCNNPTHIYGKWLMNKPYCHIITKRNRPIQQPA